MSEHRSLPCTRTGNPKRRRCPANGQEYAGVSTTTIKHHISRPWNWRDKEQGYYFCSDPECNVVYFGEDDTVIDKGELRTRVGLKDRSGTALVCYCFGVTKIEAVNNPDVATFVRQETGKRTCACETRNPSGRCCLADFPRS